MLGNPFKDSRALRAEEKGSKKMFLIPKKDSEKSLIVVALWPGKAVDSLPPFRGRG